jgi:hypothetical protein
MQYRWTGNLFVPASTQAGNSQFILEKPTPNGLFLTSQLKLPPQVLQKG